MSGFCRELTTDVQVESFVDDILCIDSKNKKRYAINAITQAERNIKDYHYFPTLTHRDNRNFEYRDDNKRNKLRTRIVKELFENKCLLNDDDIKLGKGGAAPLTDIQYNKIAFYIIGPPASGKSGIARKIADEFGCYILDSDFAKRKLPEFSNQIGAASLIHDESDSLIFLKNGLLDKCIDKGANIVIPKIGHDINSIEKFCVGLKNVGYTVYLISVDLDRQKATQRAYHRFISTKRYVPLSLIFDGYGNQPTLNYFKLKQKNAKLFNGFGQISTDVPKGEPVVILESINVDLHNIDWE